MIGNLLTSTSIGAQGHIRYLRPEYQPPNYRAETKPEQTDLAIESPVAVPTAAAKLTWPKTVREQIAILKPLLATHGNNVPQLSARFGKKAPKREAQIQDLLNTLSDLGQL